MNSRTNGTARGAPPRHNSEYYRPSAEDVACAREHGFRIDPPHGKPARASGREPVIVPFSTIARKPIEWLMPDWLPRGMLVVIDGDPGLGKSTLGVDLAARVSRGWPMPPSMRRKPVARPAAVLLLSDEDPAESVIAPRLDAAGADDRMVYHFSDIRVSADEGGDENRPVELPYDLELAEKFINERHVAIVIVDPLMSYLGAEFDPHKDQDVRRCLRRLGRLADRTRACIILVRHLNKETGGPALYRGGGSIGIIGAARSGVLVGRDPDDKERFVLAHNKPQYGRAPRSLAFRLEGLARGSRLIAWEGECDLTADDILWRPKAPGRPPERRSEAAAWLAEQLSAGPRAVREVRKSAEAAGISRPTLKRAKQELKVETRRVKGKGYCWLLPPG